MLFLRNSETPSKEETRMEPKQMSFTKQTLHIYWQHASRHPWKIVVFIVGIGAITTTRLLGPKMSSGIIDALISRGQGVHSPYWYLWWGLVVAILHNTSWRTMGLTASRFQPRVVADLYNTAFSYMLKHSYRFFTNTYVGSIASRLRRFPFAFGTVDDRVKWNISPAIALCVVLIYLMFRWMPVVGWLFLGWSVMYLTSAYTFANAKLKHDLKANEQESKISGFISDVISNAINVQLFTATEREMQSFKQLTDELYRLRRKSAEMAEYTEIMQGVAAILLETTVMYFGITACLRGTATVGEVVLLQLNLSLLFGNLWDLGANIRETFEALANANEMTEMLQQPHEIVDELNAEPLQIERGEVLFSNVSFRYAATGKDVLTHFNLRVPAGKRVAFVGLSGAGKSTIVKLLLRLYDVTHGQIFIDGQDIRRVTLNSLRSAIAYVPQDPSLFHRSFADIIGYSDPQGSMDRILKAAEQAYAHDFIGGYRTGYDTLVGERGATLSGGERQRIAIARAIYKNAPIVVLDEATSALDSESEQFIQQAIHNLMDNKTLFVIAHRLSTIKEMDVIVVMDQGQIAEIGTHDELLAIEDGIYRRLWEKQVGGFVPADSPAK